MFRCITDLRALAIDVDSFRNVEIGRWSRLNETLRCLFIVSEKEVADALRAAYPDSIVDYMEKFMKTFAPSQASHARVLKKLGLKAYEIAYLSADILFLNNASSFLGGTIWLTDSVSYEEASKAPDLICRNLDDLERLLQNQIKGFLGETYVYPNEEKSGMVIPVQFQTMQGIVPLYMMGRYFGNSHYMNQLHPYSTAIALNKRKGKLYYGKFDDVFARLYIQAVRRIQKEIDVHGIVSVPVRPGRQNRFKYITEKISKECVISDLSSYFVCVHDYLEQKGLPASERQDNIKDAFMYSGDLYGKNIVIIDDIVTTGSTIRECIKELRKHSAAQVFVVVLAVNQIEGAYWSYNLPKVSCPKCGSKMNLMINSSTRQFFYSCYKCKPSTTISFDEGHDKLCECAGSVDFDI